LQPMGERAMRPFWIHQAAEYLIGIAIVAQGIQDPKPIVPAVVGGLVVLNAAVVRGPLSAFKWFRRGMHKWIDVGMMGVIVVAALNPWIETTASGRLTLLIMVLPLGFLWFYTDWAERPARRQRRQIDAGPTGEKIGRSAGRIAGSGYMAAKQAIKKRSG